MADVKVNDQSLKEAAMRGVDSFLTTIVAAFQNAVGSKELDTDVIAKLTSNQITLWAYILFRDELCDGGFIQLIHNGYGPFFFLNPFAKAMRLWGLKDFSKFLYRARELYEKHRTMIEISCTDQEFMGLYEQFPDFEDLDDIFMEQEEDFTNRIAFYVDEHIDDFLIVE